MTTKIRCPKCNEEIDYLRNIVSGSMAYDLNVDEDGNEYYDSKDDFISDEKTNEFWCPECSEVLFTNEEEAIEFLKGYDKLQQIISKKVRRERLKCRVKRGVS